MRSCRTTIVTSCSKRKRAAPLPALSARALAPGKLETVATEWNARVSSAIPSVGTGSALYCGRQIHECMEAANSLEAMLVIISAGLGALLADKAVAPYSLTISQGSEDNILTKVDEKCGSADWWQAITSQSCRIIGLRSALGDNLPGLLLFGMPSSYLRMIEREIEQFSDEELSRVRVFTAPSFRFADDRLRRVMMPYDSRLDGSESPLPGTATDFSARALRDFSAEILPALPDGDIEDHRRAVSERLQGWTSPIRHNRRPQTDEQIKAAIRTNWSNAGGSASQMLRFIRSELGFACEQSRMRDLYNLVRSDMEQLS